MSFLIIAAMLAFAPLCLCGKTSGGYLYPQFYDRTCPKAKEIVYSIVAKAVAREARMAASLIRLHFHDCFVKVCACKLVYLSSAAHLLIAYSVINTLD